MRSRSLAVTALAVATACLDSPRYTRAPADAWFSVGVVRNGGSIPQSSSSVKLAFLSGTPGPALVRATRVATPMVLDGDASDWSKVPESVIPLVSPGAILGMTEAQWDSEYQAYYEYRGICQPGGPCTLPVYDFGIKEVKVRAAYDDDRIWFLLQWEDADESRDRRPWIWQAATASWVQDTTVDEDKLFLSFDIDRSFKPHDTLGCAAACHVRENLGDPAAPGRFSMHTAAAGQKVDGWTWRAARTDPLGLADDQYWDEVRIRSDCPDPPACTQVCNTSVGTSTAPPCSKSMAPSNSNGLTPAAPIWMGEGGIDSNPPFMFLGGAGTPAAVPIDPLAVPTDLMRLPSFALQLPSLHRDEVKARGRWSAGIWTLEMERALVTTDPNDAQFPLQ